MKDHHHPNILLTRPPNTNLNDLCIEISMSTTVKCNGRNGLPIMTSWCLLAGNTSWHKLRPFTRQAYSSI